MPGALQGGISPKEEGGRRDPQVQKTRAGSSLVVGQTGKKTIQSTQIVQRNASRRTARQRTEKTRQSGRKIEQNALPKHQFGQQKSTFRKRKKVKEGAFMSVERKGLNLGGGWGEKSNSGGKGVRV